MIFPANHTSIFIWYLRTLDSESQRVLRPLIDIMTDPKCTERQRLIAYNYIDTWRLKNVYQDQL